jgi:pyrimidine operon attenuation protein/uracil phosphoribosyltransferase
MLYICTMPKKIQLLDAQQADQRLTRLAYEIFENNIDEKEIVLVGIIDRGEDLSKILKKKIEAISSLEVQLVSLKLDKTNPINAAFAKDFDPTDKSIVLVDDVANSGKTMMYALKPFMLSIAKKIQIAVLIDRQHKRFPIASDYIGLQLSTTVQDHITVEIEKGKVLGAYIE